MQQPLNKVLLCRCFCRVQFLWRETVQVAPTLRDKVPPADHPPHPPLDSRLSHFIRVQNGFAGVIAADRDQYDSAELVKCKIKVHQHSKSVPCSAAVQVIWGMLDQPRAFSHQSVSERGVHVRAGTHAGRVGWSAREVRCMAPAEVLGDSASNNGRVRD